MPHSAPEHSAALARICRHARDVAGMAVPENRWPELERSAQQLAQAEGLGSLEACAAWLTDGRHRRRSVEWLSHVLPVGETYFFRDRPALELCVAHIIGRGAPGAAGRIWSAGCCTGEEPYSLAMLLSGQGRLDGTHIVGTDLSPEFLSKARRGEYSEWSFRNTPPAMRSRYFVEVAPGRHRLRRDIRKAVHFCRQNLAHSHGPSPQERVPFDIILCRNVLMYLTEDAQSHALNLFRRYLAPGGLLLVNAAESQIVEGSLFTRAGLGTGVYTCSMAAQARPHREREVSSKEIHQEQVRPEPATSLPHAPNHEQAADVAPPAFAHRQGTVGRGPAALETIAALYLAGDWPEALERCERLVRSDRVDARAQYLLGLLLQAAERGAEALQAIEAAVYLDPEHPGAHLALGHLYGALEQRARSRRHFRNAARLFEQQDQDETIPLLGGLTAGRLAHICQSLAAKGGPDES